MKPLNIDLGLPRDGVDRALRFAIVVMLTAGLSLGAYALVEAQRVRPGLAVDVSAPASFAERVPSIPPYTEDAAKWSRVASMPIGRVLAQVEAVQVTGVRVNRLEIDAQARTATIELEASDHAAAMAWFSTADHSEGGCAWKLQQSRQQGASVVAAGAATC